MKTHKNVLLFYCEEMRDLAQQVVARNDDIELRSISWRSHTLLSQHHFAAAANAASY
jgi:hypothetical protein